MLRRLRDPHEGVVFAPEFRRELEEPIAGTVAIAPQVPVVVTALTRCSKPRPWSRTGPA